MVVMPLGPLVRLKGSERLLRKMRTISPKPERHDGEVVAAQLQRRRAEQYAEGAGDRGADAGEDRGHHGGKVTRLKCGDLPTPCRHARRRQRIARRAPICGGFLRRRAHG